MGPWRDIWNPFNEGRELEYFSLSLACFLSFLLFLLFFPSFLFLFFFLLFFFFRVRACGVLQHPKHPPWTRHWHSNSIFAHSFNFHYLTNFEKTSINVVDGFYLVWVIMWTSNLHLEEWSMSNNMVSKRVVICLLLISIYFNSKFKVKLERRKHA